MQHWSLATLPGGPTAVFLLFTTGGVAAFLAAVEANGAYQSAVVALGILALVGIAAVDLRTRRAPNRIVYPLGAASTLSALALGWSHGLDALGGGVLAFAVLLAAVVAGRGSMGYGDAKVGYVCGAIVGIRGVLPMMLGTFLVGGAFAGLVLLLRIRSRKDTVAFTPFLLVGVVVAVLVAGESVYLKSA